LIDLIDEGFTINLNGGSVSASYITIHIIKRNGFRWNNIKNKFIPFLTILNDEYSVNKAIDFLVEDSDSDVNFFVNKDKIINDVVDNLIDDEFNQTEIYLPLNMCAIYYINITLKIQ